MAYIKREKYTVKNDDIVKSEMLEALAEKGLPEKKIKQLVFYPTPMSLIRWSNYLEPSEMKLFLEPLEAQREGVEEVEEEQETAIEEEMSNINFGF